ncbi:MAG: CBS domain-containing protein [Candidatus Bathyarchaeota archaeon]|nr:CBS domain-containing protein [Candidatus Bathyarchaeota archaeon]
MISTVYEVMTPDVVTITPDQTIEAAARVMVNHGISSVVVYEEGKPLGILTEKDIMTRIVAVGQDPRKVTVAEIMTPEIVACDPDTLIEDACRTMQRNKIKKLAVVDGGSLKGIVSLTDIANRQPELIDSLKNRNGGVADDIFELLNLSEGQYLEFKSSLRYDYNTKQVNQCLEQVVLKTLCAFLNAEGGTLLIGLSDEKTVVGIENDYRVIRNQNRDGFENHLLGLVSNCIGNYYLQYVSVVFHNVLGKDLCQVNVQYCPKPAFLNNGDKQEFYVRTGNNSRPFTISEASDYIREHWR